MTCPHCGCAGVVEQSARVLELEAQVEALVAERRRLRERVAVMVGKVAAAFDLLETEAAREPDAGNPSKTPHDWTAADHLAAVDAGRNGGESG